jgi:hypothetical protein
MGAGRGVVTVGADATTDVLVVVAPALYTRSNASTSAATVW